jgi:hypothetical protein
MDRQRAAEALGMKLREVTAVDRIGDTWVITTHDRQRTVVNDAGEVLGRGDLLVDGTAPADPAAAGQTTPAAVEATVTEAEAPTAADVPTGTIEEVLTWVGDDPLRAQLAAAVESQRDTPRATLAQALDKIRVAALG